MIYQYQCNSTTECKPIETILQPGKYLLECYGAQGGTGLENGSPNNEGGRGAYASGILHLKQTTTFYLYIGAKGQKGVNQLNTISYGGWNGGGNGGKDTGFEPGDIPDTPGGGGGATDIRLVRAPDGEESTNETSLDSRIIVAAGGSRSSYNTYGAPGGDLTGYIVTAVETESYDSLDSNQDSDYQKGKGANGVNSMYAPSAGSGGGYYGGITGASKDSTVSDMFKIVSSSGSSYVA